MKYIIKKGRFIVFMMMVFAVISGWIFISCYDEPSQLDYQLTNELDGNLFPSAILSTAATEARLIVPVDSSYLGNSKSAIAVRINSQAAQSKLKITIAETPYFAQSVSEFILEKPDTEYLVYPDILWDYKALKANDQSAPLNIAIRIELNGKDLGRKTQTVSMRSINDCLLGYSDRNNKYHDTGKFFAAYVNENHPMIDQVLREALDAQLVDRFLGYQAKSEENIDRQVFALWNTLQKRNFKYSSVSNTSLSSDVVYAQRVRTLDNAFMSSQINCVDGTVLFASLLKAINIDPILVRTPGHIFIGYYTDNKHTNKKFLEITLIGEPVKSMESSIATFKKAMDVAGKKYEENKEGIHSGKVNYMFLEISKELRADIQPIGR